MTCPTRRRSCQGSEVKTVGWSNNTFQVVIITGSTGSGLFVYSPVAGAGNLVASISANGGTDPFGNVVEPGVCSYNPGTGAMCQVNGGVFGLLTGPAGGAGPYTLRAVMDLVGNNLNIACPATSGGQIFIAPDVAQPVTISGTPTIVQSGLTVSSAGASISGASSVTDAQAGTTPIVDITNTASATAPILRTTANAIGDLFLGNRVAGDTNSRLVLDTTGTGLPRIRFGPGNAAPDVNLTRPAANTLNVNAGDLDIATVGRGLQVKEGANARMGTATLVAGTVVVSNTTVTAATRIFLTCLTPGGTPGFLRVSALVAGTSFTITSGSATDTSVVSWLLVEAG